MVEFGPAIKGDAGDGKGDGVRDTGFPLAVVSGDGVHIVKGKCGFIRKALKAFDGQRAHGKAFQCLNHICLLLIMPRPAR